MSLAGPLAAKIASYTERYGNSAIRLSCSVEPPALVLNLSGALDTASSSDLYDILVSAIGLARESGGMSVDLSGLHYVSSTGIGVLSTAMIEYGKARVGFRLRAVPARIKALFETLGLWSYFPVDAAAPGGEAGDA